DDITASVVVPMPLECADLSALSVPRLVAAPLATSGQTQGADQKPRSGVSLKFVQNCEKRLFQRPDDAIHRGYDKQTEADFAKPDSFFSNYEPLDLPQARELIEDSIGFHEFTDPMQKLIRE